MARYVDEGVSVLVVTCTGGERGSVLNPALQGDPHIEANIASIRQQEMAAARAILGIDQEWLGFVDSGLPEGDPLPPLPDGCFGLTDVTEGTERLVAAIRRFRPHVMTTYDENGGYPHPDHIMTHRISVAAFDAAGDPDAFPDAGEPWQPLKLYYDIGFSRRRMMAFHESFVSRGEESPYQEMLEGWADRPDNTDRITTRVDCADWFPRRDAALKAHATQVDPLGRWFRMPMEQQRQIWPTEDYQLVRTLVDSGSPTFEDPEDDLFAGIRERVTS